MVPIDTGSLWRRYVDSNDDGSVEINLGRQSRFLKNQFGYSKPRNFRNKIEGIWDAEQKLKNKKY